MASDRTLGNGYDTEPFTARQRRQYARLVDAEHRSAAGLAADMQARVGIAGDHEGIDIVAAGHQFAERQRYAFHVLLRLDAVRPFRQGVADNLGPLLELDRRQGIGQSSSHDLV